MPRHGRTQGKRSRQPQQEKTVEANADSQRVNQTKLNPLATEFVPKPSQVTPCATVSSELVAIVPEKEEGGPEAAGDCSLQHGETKKQGIGPVHSINYLSGCYLFSCYCHYRIINVEKEIP